MGLYSRILEILNDNKLGVNQFVEKTNFPKTTFYKLKKGEVDTITNKVGWKIIDAFPDYKFDWLMTGNDDSNLRKVKTKKNDGKLYNSQGELASYDQIASFIKHNLDELKNEDIFKNIIDIEALKILLKAKEGDNINIDKIG